MGNKIPGWKKSVVVVEDLKSSLFEYSAKNLHGSEEVPLSKYENSKALIVVNVASKCGLTPGQYNGLVKLKKEVLESYADSNFEILGFPCSQFSNQEFDDPNKIKEFVCQFKVDFPLFEKTNVNGPATHPVFQFLKYHTPELHKGTTLEAIGWNFGKFLVDGKGHVVKYYGPQTDPAEMKPEIEKLIKSAEEGSGAPTDEIA